MIFDHRTYNIKPNRLAKFLETYERLALPLQRKHLAVRARGNIRKRKVDEHRASSERTSRLSRTSR